MDEKPEHVMHTAECERCRASFEYKAYPSDYRKGGWTTRSICDTCRYARRSQGNVTRRERLRVEGGSNMLIRSNGSTLTQAEIAKKLRINKSTVEMTERMVFKKIRNNPELKKIWSTIKSDFSVAAVALREALSAAEEGNRLLDYQLAVAEFWEAYDKISTAGCTAEAVECLDEIKKCQEKILKTLNNLDVERHDHSQ